MNIVAIQTFLAVVRTRNLNRAAEELNVTQSAVTARLDALDQALGARLLTRSRKGTALTKAGYAFLDQAEVIVSTWSNAKARAGLPRGVTRLFSFVCAPALWSGLGEVWLDAVRAAHPETAAEVWAGLAVDADRWLASGMSDAALLPERLTGAGIESRVFAEDRLVQVSAEPRRAMAWDPAYVFVDYGPGFRNWHTETWPSDETAANSFSNPDWALSHLLSHGGSAYLPDGMVKGLVADNRLFPVDGSAAYDRRSYLSWRKESETGFPWLPGIEITPL